jgi:hypothetical protein
MIETPTAHTQPDTNTAFALTPSEREKKEKKKKEKENTVNIFLIRLFLCMKSRG